MAKRTTSSVARRQEFVVLKEEGQSRLHAANTWGEKASAHSSGEGRQLIQRRLQRLQTDWDALQTTTSETRAALEACALRWSSYDESQEQVRRWLQEMERRIRDTQPRADLGEKRAQLQRMKVGRSPPPPREDGQGSADGGY